VIRKKENSLKIFLRDARCLGILEGRCK